MESLQGRDQDIERTWELVAERSILLTGPRRVGKTSLMEALQEAPRSGWRVVLVDLQGKRDVASVLPDLRQVLESAGLGPSRIADGAARIHGLEIGGIAGLSLRDQSKPGPWESLQLLVNGAMGQLEQGERLLICMDELPWWIDGISETAGEVEARSVLAKLRALRMRHDGLRMVLTGSIGIESLAHRLGATAELNDVTPAFELCPLQPAHGAALFETEVSARGRLVDSAVAASAHVLAAGYPHWIKLLAERAALEVERESRVGDKDLAAARDHLLAPRQRKLFADEGIEHFRRRDRGASAAGKRAILDAACDETGAPIHVLETAAMTQGAASKKHAREWVYALMDTFHLQQMGDRFHFSLPLFRLWWERYGGQS